MTAAFINFQSRHISCLVKLFIKLNERMHSDLYRFFVKELRLHISPKTSYNLFYKWMSQSQSVKFSSCWAF